MFDFLPKEIEDYIFLLKNQMLFADVKKELDTISRTIYKVNPNYDICRGIFEYKYGDKKLKQTDKYIYIFNFSSNEID